MKKVNRLRFTFFLFLKEFPCNIRHFRPHEKAYADAKQMLIEKRALLDEISEFLLVKETITGDELMAYVNADKAALPEAQEEPAEE